MHSANKWNLHNFDYRFFFSVAASVGVVVDVVIVVAHYHSYAYVRKQHKNTHRNTQTEFRSFEVTVDSVQLATKSRLLLNFVGNYIGALCPTFKIISFEWYDKQTEAFNATISTTNYVS